MKNNLHKLWQNKIVRYAVWGWSAAVLDLLLLWLCTDVWWIYYLLSQVLAFIGSLSYGFVFQKYITFRDYSKKHTWQMSKFFLFQLIWLLIGLVLLKWFVEWMWLHYLMWSAIAKVVVFARNYVMNNLFNFTDTKKSWNFYQ